MARSFLYLATQLPAVRATRSYEAATEAIVRSFTGDLTHDLDLNSSEYLTAGMISILSTHEKELPSPSNTTHSNDLGMARKNYSEELAASGGGPVRDDTGGDGAWDRSGPGNRARHAGQWLAWYGTGRKTGTDGRPAPSPLRPRQSDGSRASRQTQETASEVIARLEAADAELRAQTVKLTREPVGSFSRLLSISPVETIR